jgi:hypothetical protein
MGYVIAISRAAGQTEIPASRKDSLYKERLN